MEKAIKERNEALISLDIDYVRRQCPHAVNPATMLAALHKARYECTQIPADLRHASGAFLRERNLRRFDGSELLPEGQLP